MKASHSLNGGAPPHRTPSASAAHGHSLPPGARLRHYCIARLMGRGDIGLTYLADDTTLRRKVVIKEFLPTDFGVRKADGRTVGARSQQQANLDWARERFLEEGRAISALRHPSLLRVYDIFELNGTAYLVTGLVEGCTFEEWLRKKGALRQEDLVSVASSLLEALQLAHGQGLLHRAIQPANILMDEKTARPVLIDFGNARMAIGKRALKTTAALARGYASAEEYQTNDRRGPFTDLYSLGAVLYRAIKGAPPADALERLRVDRVQPLSQQRIPGYTREFLATIDKALQIRRENRWQNCEAWKAALRAPGAAARASSPPAPAPRNYGLAAAALALLTVAGVCIGLAINDQPEENYFASKPLSGELANVTSASTAAPAPSPSATGASPPAPPTVAQATPPPQNQTPPSPSPTTPTTPSQGPGRPRNVHKPGSNPVVASIKHPYVNTLGMNFVPVTISGGPTDGKQILFSVWDTRVQDYAAFPQATGNKPVAPDFEQGPTHPVVNVSWEDAKSFCAWLTEKERASGKIGPGDEYRLPSDHEWSCAVGIGARENADASPESKRSRITDAYPWGTQWPPPKGAGNYDPKLNVDDFEFTSPVGSFAPNYWGLYDMGGNAWQWCEDLFSSQNDNRVLRGGAWYYEVELCLRSSFRANDPPTDRNERFGFRCVLAKAAHSGKPASGTPGNPGAGATATPVPIPTPGPNCPPNSGAGNSTPAPSIPHRHSPAGTPAPNSGQPSPSTASKATPSPASHKKTSPSGNGPGTPSPINR